MAKLYFYYAAMNAGKSAVLLQSDHNYREQGLKTLLFTPRLDDRYGEERLHQESVYKGQHMLLKVRLIFLSTFVISIKKKKETVSSLMKRNFSHPSKCYNLPL